MKSSKLLKFYLFLLFFLFADDLIHAQSLKTAELSPTGSITLFFDTSFRPEDKTAAGNKSNYAIINLQTQTFVPIESVQFVDVPGFDSNMVELIVVPGMPLDVSQETIIFARNLTFLGKPLRNPLQVRLAVGIPNRIQPAQKPFSFQSSPDRESSNIYISGEVTGASGEKTFSSVDVKISIPFLKQFWGKVHTFSPFFELKASTNPKADPDTIKFGGSWVWPIFTAQSENSRNGTRELAGSSFSDIFWTNSLKVEGNRDFNNINGVWESRFTAPLSVINRRETKLFLDPFIGSEIGYNIESPLPEAQNSTITRFFVGASLVYVFPIQKDGQNVLTFESSYIRRWLLEREITFFEKDGEIKPLQITTKPRDFIEAKLNLQLNKFFGMFAGYEYGKLPPAFNLVDHRYRLGLVYKLRIDRVPR